MEQKLRIYDPESGETLEVEPIERTSEQWRELLNPEQYRVAREHDTERAFANEYHDTKTPGIYECACCGTPLFDAKSKYDSGTGWPSFYEPLSELNIGTSVDRKLFMARIEVHCARCRAHLGHIFDDGPAPTGKRYCMNSAALRLRVKASY